MGLTDNNGLKTFSMYKLSWDGSNWVAWKAQMLTTLMPNKGVMHHLDGKAQQLAPIPKFAPNHTLDEDEVEALEAAERRCDEYHQCKVQVRVQIFTTIPESLSIKVCNLSSAEEIWDAKHESKTLMVNVDICRRMYEMKCEDESDIEEMTN